MKIHTLVFGIIIFSLGMTSSVVSADPYCRKCPLSCQDIGLGHKDCSALSNTQGVCCVDLTQKGLKLAQEQERILGASTPVPAETCPRGFQPSERKCSVEERRRGCKDMRLPGGLGCVHR